MAGRAVRKKIQGLLRKFGETDAHMNAGVGNKDIAMLKKTFRDPTKAITNEAGNSAMFDALMKSSGGFMSPIQAKYYMPKGTKIEITRLSDGEVKTFTVSSHTTKKIGYQTMVRPTLRTTGKDSARVFGLSEIPLQASFHGKSLFTEVKGGKQKDYWKARVVRPQ